MKNLLCLTILFLLSISFSLAQRAVEIDSLVVEYYENDKPGISLAVIQNGKSIYNHEIGKANLEYGIDISDSTSFLLASVSKQFTAYLALLLEQEGKLNMEEDIRVYLPELGALKHKITPIHLANHTHGLPNVSELKNIKGFGESDRMWHEDIVNMALNIQTFNFAPGDEYQYNNTGYVLLSEIIKRQSGMSFQNALDYYIFTPLRMNSSIAESSPDQYIKNEACSYRQTPSGYTRYDNNIMANGSSGIRTTIKDLSLWVQFIQSELKINNSLINRMAVNFRLNSGEYKPYGLGLETKKYRGTQAVFHGGGTTGHRAYTLHIPQHELSVLILGNSNDYWILALAYKIVDLYLEEELAPQPMAKKVNITPKKLEAYEGTYEIFPGSYYIFSAQSDSLFFEILGSPGKEYLEPLAVGQFVYPYYPESKIVFKENSVELNIADFIYSYKEANPTLKQYTPEELSFYTGYYKSESLNTIYEIVVENNRLVARHPINYDVPLSGLVGESFFSPYWYFSRLDFKRDSTNRITGFLVSGQNFIDLPFDKICD